MNKRMKIKTDINLSQTLAKGVVPITHALICCFIGLYTQESKIISSFALIVAMFYLFKAIHTILEDITIMYGDDSSVGEDNKKIN